MEIIKIKYFYVHGGSYIHVFSISQKHHHAIALEWHSLMKIHLYGNLPYNLFAIEWRNVLQCHVYWIYLQQVNGNNPFVSSQILNPKYKNIDATCIIRNHNFLEGSTLSNYLHWPNMMFTLIKNIEYEKQMVCLVGFVTKVTIFY